MSLEAVYCALAPPNEGDLAEHAPRPDAAGVWRWRKRWANSDPLDFNGSLGWLKASYFPAFFWADMPRHERILVRLSQRD